MTAKRPRHPTRRNVFRVYETPYRRKVLGFATKNVSSVCVLRSQIDTHHVETFWKTHDDETFVACTHDVETFFVRLMSGNTVSVFQWKTHDVVTFCSTFAARHPSHRRAYRPTAVSAYGRGNHFERVHLAVSSSWLDAPLARVPPTGGRGRR